VRVSTGVRCGTVIAWLLAIVYLDSKIHEEKA
jgi:hypothetical protein